MDLEDWTLQLLLGRQWNCANDNNTNNLLDLLRNRFKILMLMLMLKQKQNKSSSISDDGRRTRLTQTSRAGVVWTSLRAFLRISSSYFHAQNYGISFTLARETSVHTSHVSSAFNKLRFHAFNCQCEDPYKHDINLLKARKRP